VIEKSERTKGTYYIEKVAIHPDYRHKGEGKKIMDFAEYLDSINKSYCSDVPAMTDTQEFVDDLVHLLFPIRTNKNISRFEIEIQLERMQLRLKQLMLPLEKDLKKTPREIAKIFFDKLPNTFKNLLQDADTFINSDPASQCVEEVILCYPGFYALTVHRLSHIQDLLLMIN